MLFNSFGFIFLFLPAVFSTFRITAMFHNAKGTIVILILSSLFFYGYWNPTYVTLIMASILFNFAVSRTILNKKWGNIPLIFGISANLATICFFKYFNFFMQNSCKLIGVNWSNWNILLPLGISFFTFQQIAYLVDCHQGEVENHSFLDYALFVSFFPQLIAGPIVHHTDILPQIREPNATRLRFDYLSKGFTLFALGLFKKVIIADALSPIVVIVFDGPHTPNAISAWMGALAYTFQIYFDFSGYSEMALGLGRMFNIKLPLNFDTPYKALSIVDFWKRWHITLSNFLKNYLYIPLGGNRKGQSRRYINLMATMLLGGLWHGAAWTFVIWGMLHGVYLCINHAAKIVLPKLNVRIPSLVNWMLTFFSVVVAWVMFRATSVRQAVHIYKCMLGMNGISNNIGRFYFDLNLDYTPLFAPWERPVLLIFISAMIAFFLPPAWKFGQRDDLYKSVTKAVTVTLVFIIAVLSLTNVTEFLYFQF